jgi:hypothetical protein
MLWGFSVKVRLILYISVFEMGFFWNPDNFLQAKSGFNFRHFSAQFCISLDNCCFFFFLRGATKLEKKI